MSQSVANHNEQLASKVILSDLIDALFFEDVFELYSKGRVIHQDEQTLFVYQHEDQRLEIPVYLSSINVYRFARSQGEVKLYTSHKTITLNAVSLWDTLVMMHPDEAKQLNSVRFREGLVQACQQLAAQYQDLDLAEHPFVQSEQFASLKDRPFHPLAKEKRGLNASDYARFQAEYNAPMALKVVALHRDWVMASQHANEATLQCALNITNNNTFHQYMEAQGLNPENYMLFPVHPWQFNHVLPHYFEQEIKEKVIVPLDMMCGRFVSSSSMRTLIDIERPFEHIKVPFAMQSLGALRLTPTRYLLNGEKGEALLEQVRQQSEYLKTHLLLCDEKQWWSFIAPSKNIFEDRTGHLTVQLRQYPEVVKEDNTVVISMAALAMADTRVLESVFGHCDFTAEEVEAIYQDIVTSFIHTLFACMRRGILPEVHGQNVLVAFQNGRVRQFILRDHDTVRIYPTWMTLNGMDVPEYAIRKDTPNTLINDDLETFFTYFQTLGILVNVYAIIDTFASLYQLDEQRLMAFLRQTMKQAVDETKWPNGAAEVRQLLFDKETWPFKRILLPLLHQKDSGGGSMPSSIGEIVNPMMSYD
ncbi:staphyloferrin B biosynthesis protein SbnC [Staphylococcus agnetis]|uniref:staphyloferrin B biosynthesis protein SbnC n=1 Tax=Staphylococcus agnetis TaxID=985762 RepID=UPI000D02A61D|nr:staphyloferrin B biosynthesis protein SbnC [Staphylococcus agnetis]